MGQHKRTYEYIHHLMRIIKAYDEPVNGSRLDFIYFFKEAEENPYIAYKIYTESPDEWRATSEKAARILSTPRKYPPKMTWYGADIVEADLEGDDDAISD